MAIINEIIREYSSEYNPNAKETSIILAAGHGKRIKSQTSKMLHKIWEVSTVERVCNACERAFENSNLVVVVGIKAEEVVKAIGKKISISFAYQETQNGTGHAVQVALEKFTDKNYNGTVYIFPGDMGLIDVETIKFFKEEFEKSKSDMMVLTGIYDGEIADNYYGRIVRVKDKDAKGVKSKDKGKVIEILEYKDIVNLNDKKPRELKYNKKQYKYSRKELIENREFNSGVYAFKFKPLAQLIQKIQSNNVQNEIYLTDLITLFNNNGYTVEAVSPKNQYVVMGFNNKSVLKEMDAIARGLVYEKLKDIITIDDPDDFFIEENVVEQILQMDKQGVPLDIHIGRGVYIGKRVKLNYNLAIAKNVLLDGDIQIGKNVILKESTHISCFYGQKIEVGDNVEIHWSAIIKGNVTIGNNCRIESGVRITGSDNFPTTLGNNVIVKGITSIFGSQIDSHIIIEHSVLVEKKIAKPENVKSDFYCIRYYFPEAEGRDAVQPLYF
jgi:bifunctional UDP-N-acetylglucosamine pyrophosphorylase/glucosamine-1-phosphate N-acetyltransferase